MIVHMMFLSVATGLKISSWTQVEWDPETFHIIQIRAQEGGREGKHMASISPSARYYIGIKAANTHIPVHLEHAEDI